MTKEKVKVVKDGKSTRVLSVPAYTDSKLVGWAQVTVFKEDEAGLTAAKASLTLSDVVDLNRQKVTDAKNNLRRGTSVMAALKGLVKANPAVAKIVELLAAQAASGTFDPKALEAIEASLKDASSK